MCSSMKAENECQGRALQILNPERDPFLDVCICELYGADWRQILTDYKAQHGRVPTEDDLIWISSEHLGADIREHVRGLVSELD